jgi:GT2 family glycosyltransferase
MSARVGLVTVLFNSAGVLPDFMQSLAGQSYADYWLFIIDNSLDELSSAAAQQLIARHGFQNITLIKNAGNLGVAAANNQGIERSLAMGCDYVLLLNNDIEFKDRDLLAKMVALADARQEKLMVPKIYFHDSGRIWCAGGDLSNWKGTTTHRGEGEADAGQFDADGYTVYAPTCFMLIHKSVFAAVGLMDEKYFVYHDDTDFVWRANRAGFRIYYFAEGQVRHKVSSSTGGNLSPFSIYYGERNRIYFIRKNYSLPVQALAFSYYFLTRPLKWRLLRQPLRQSFFSGMRDGFNMTIPR